MTRVSDVCVKSVGNWQKAKFGNVKEVKVAKLKELSSGKVLNLSLKKTNMKVLNSWEKILAPGNVLKVVITKSPDKKDPYIDFLGGFELIEIKPVNKKEGDDKAYTNISEASNLIIENELEKLRKLEEKDREFRSKLEIERGKCYAIIKEASISS